MADPHSVWTLLSEVIRSAKMADDCKVECELLATRLEGFKQPVMEIEKNSKKGNVRCKKWLTEFKGLLERARCVTNECARRTTLKFWRWKKLPARVVEISSQIEESTTWASIFLPVRCNCSQCDALAEVYRASMKRISALVLLALMETSTGHHDDAVLFLLRSLAEIKRCICRGTIYTSSCPVGLEVPFIDHSEALCLSRMGSFLLRDFSFCMALVQVAFYRFIVKLNVSDILENPVGWKINKGIAVKEFCKGQLSDFFETCGEGCGRSCERSCRPVLKQQFVKYGRQVVQHPSVTEYLYQLRRGSVRDLVAPWKQVLEAEASPKPTDLGLVKIDYARDIQERGFLGKGSYGAVLKCIWRDQDMVVKIINLCPEDEKLFEKEVTILSSVQHPNAVQIFGFGYRAEGTQRQGFILMERMEMDLSRLIQGIGEGGDSTPGLVFPLDITLDLLFQVVEGMCYMKEKGVIHRDIKPANILVNRLDKGRDPFDRFYHLKLADFGTSKVNEDNSVFNTAKLGTTAYMAPEVMSPTIIDEETGNRGYTFKADVYSLGMVCSEILTGKKPFQNISSRDIHLAVLAGERPDLPLDDVDPLRRLIEDCWSSNPEARPNIWQVCQRLWECRLYCISKMERPAMNWKTFHTDLESRSKAIRSTIKYHERLHVSTRSLTKLPEILSNLVYLTKLNFSRFHALKELPESIGNLVCLTHLDLHSCSSLKELPESMGNLVCLRHLYLSFCSSLKELPESMGNLVCLTHLDLTECTSLKELPESMGNLECLTHLDLHSCEYLEELPESMGNLECLTHLDLSFCLSLKELPESIGNLECLTHFILRECRSLEKLPESISNLVCLTHLDLSWCLSWKQLLEFPESLRKVIIFDLLE